MIGNDFILIFLVGELRHRAPTELPWSPASEVELGFEPRKSESSASLLTSLVYNFAKGSLWFSVELHFEVSEKLV